MSDKKPPYKLSASDRHAVSALLADLWRNPELEARVKAMWERSTGERQ